MKSFRRLTGMLPTKTGHDSISVIHRGPGSVITMLKLYVSAKLTSVNDERLLVCLI